MKQLAILAAALVVGACGAEPVPSAETKAENVVINSPVVGIYGGVGMDNVTWTSELKSDGTYIDTQGGEIVETGTWSHQDDEICFVPHPAQGLAGDKTCLQLVNINDDGSLVMTDGQGNEAVAPRLPSSAD